jgi:DNA polymerase III delta prime subunit
MSRLQAIEKELVSINGAIFQELCDSFLSLRNKNYSVFSRTGSQSGKQKTTIGTPDSFLLLPNGKYIFVEYSTNITAGVSKLKDDINKCIDVTKTGVALSEISEIILCTNFNLKTDEVEELKTLLSRTYIQLTIYTLDSLAIELHFNHRDLTNQYLGLTLDTGQIVSIEKFIDEYNNASKGISTPLNNTFLHREKELDELNNAIELSDFVILTGAPGVGKTKLALEAITSFLSKNLDYNAYCISYKNHTLLDDLYQHLNSDEDYILFVDDANRIDAFNQIIGFYKSIRTGKLKIVLTVRDYAFQEMALLCQEFSPSRIDLMKLNDEQIKDIIEAEPFEILNPEYQKVIIQISDGNPRLAIMTSLLAKAEQNIYVLSDISDLFEKYFSTFIKDDGEFANNLNIKILGIIAFFYTIPYKERELTEAILEKFDITYDDFIESIDKLDKLELVEIQYEHIKIPEQNLGTYFFYKAFVKDNLISFDILLEHYFESNTSRFNDCVIPANNTFGHKNVIDKIKPKLQVFWHKIESESKRAIKLLSTFWYYLQEETFHFIYILIEKLEEDKVQEYVVAYDNNQFAHNKDDVIELLGNFFRFTSDLKNALELSFEYVRKQPKHLPELIHKIRGKLSFDVEDERFRFERQSILFDFLIDGVKRKDNLYFVVFFELSKTFTAFKYHQFKSGRNNSFSYYDYPIPPTKAIKSFREKIWITLIDNFDYHPIKSFNVLLNYSSRGRDISKDLLEFDVNFILKIINEKLDKDNFRHCKYVQKLIKNLIANSIDLPVFQSLKERFTNETYKIFLLIDWDRFRDKEMFEFDDYREYDKLKENEIRKSLIFETFQEFKAFYDTFIQLRQDSTNNHNYNRSLDLLIDEHSKKNFDFAIEMLTLIIEENNNIGYVPFAIFRNRLNDIENANKLWATIVKSEFKSKYLWKVAYFNSLDESLIDENIIKNLIESIKSINERFTVYFDTLQKYLKKQPNLFQLILEIIYKKNIEEDFDITLGMDFFDNHFDDLNDDFELTKKSYIQQDKLQTSFDYEQKGLLKIISKDSDFLIEYVKSLISDSNFSLYSDIKNLEVVWTLVNAEEIITEVIDLFIKEDYYSGVSDHFCNSFFWNLPEPHNSRANKFIEKYIIDNNNDYKKMQVIVDIIRHSRKELFEKIFLLYISLNQNEKDFRYLSWRGNGTSGSGDVILADIEAADWRRILSITEKSELGIKLFPIKKYLNEQIEYCLRRGDRERQERFLSRY